MNLDALLSHRFTPETLRYGPREVMLYALGAGLGAEPADLRFVQERDLAVLPGFPCVLGSQDDWFTAPGIGIDRAQVLHLEQRIETRRPLPPEGRVQVAYRLEGVADRGPRRGAAISFGKRLSDPATGTPYADLRYTILARGDGGCGDHGAVPGPPPATPDRAPELSVTRRTDPRAALIYRLSGDMNPLHADPEVAAQAGYGRPILHGLATLGLAAHALLEEVAGGDPARVGGLACRFSRPVYPGDTLRTEIWREGQGARFRVLAEERGETVITRGDMRLAP